MSNSVNLWPFIVNPPLLKDLSLSFHSPPFHPTMHQVTSQLGAFVRGVMQEVVCRTLPSDSLSGGQLSRRKRLNALLRTDPGGLTPEDAGIDWVGQLLSLAPEMVGN